MWKEEWKKEGSILTHETRLKRNTELKEGNLGWKLVWGLNTFSRAPRVFPILSKSKRPKDYFRETNHFTKKKILKIKLREIIHFDKTERIITEDWIPELHEVYFHLHIKKILEIKYRTKICGPALATSRVSLSDPLKSCMIIFTL